MKQKEIIQPISDENIKTERHIRKPSVTQIFSRNFLFAHPVLIRGLALAPALVASIDARNSLVLTFMLLILSLPGSLFASFVGDRLPKFLRVPIYVLLAAAAYIPAYLILEKIPYTVFGNLGVFLPLLVVSSFVYNRAEKESLTLPWYLALLDTLCGALSFGIFSFILGSIREIFGAGHFFGIPVNVPSHSGLLLPFAGFILAGFLAALIQSLIRYLRQHKEQQQSTGGDEAL